MMTIFFNIKQLFLFCLLLACCQFWFEGGLLIAGGVTCGVLAFCFYKDKNGLALNAIFFSAFLLNLWYVLASFGNVRQYDYFNFVMFADYFVQNDFFLFRPLGYLQSVYFQPPLWGGIAGIFMKVLEFDYVRFISLFAVSGAMIYFWRLTGELGFKNYIRLLTFFWGCFFPFQGILANLVNNDALVYFLMTAMLYYAYRWLVLKRMREALILSGLLFAAGMIKFSGLMMVPALGVLGLYKLMTAQDKLSRGLWAQFGVIGAGACLGFAWGWFLLYFGLPLVPPPQNNAYQNMAAYSLADRLFSFNTALYPFADVQTGGIEANVFLALLKTSLFGEWRWNGAFWAEVMYAEGILFALFGVISFFYLLKYKIGAGFAFNGFLIVLVFSVLGAWANFWLDYPYFCSSEFRYTAILLPASLLWMGNFLDKKSLPKGVIYALAGGAALLAVARIMLYLHTI
ncbi:MAG: glycosyltransferase family 39 protein [Alphaproteobacteria bacterium]|nr:glycosyltransferase family 39 protein [Alphaproteobacteria bacterium]